MDIVLDCRPIHEIVTLADTLSRRDAIAAQKQALHGYRLQQLSQYVKREIQPQAICHTKYGKPYLNDVAFNHSHSPQHYALVMSQSVEDLGVDIEDLNRKIRFSGLAAHAFTPKEQQRWAQSGEDPKYWFQIWTAKEAIVKAAGLGIRLSLNTLETEVEYGQMQGQMQHERLGAFCYQQLQLHTAMVTVAWRATADMPRLHYL